MKKKGRPAKTRLYGVKLRNATIKLLRDVCAQREQTRDVVIRDALQRLADDV